VADGGEERERESKTRARWFARLSGRRVRPSEVVTAIVYVAGVVQAADLLAELIKRVWEP
jgi:hypothetical protein